MVNDSSTMRNDAGRGPCSLHPVHCLGLRSGNTANLPIQFIDADVLLFLSGRHLVLHDNVSRKQAILPSRGAVLCFVAHIGTGRLAFLEDLDGLPVIRVRQLIAGRFPPPEDATPVGDVVEPLCDLDWGLGTSSVHGLAFTHDADHVAAVAWDGTVRLWAVAEGTLVNSWQVPHEGHCVAFSPSADDFYVSVVGGGKLSVWSCDCNHVAMIGTENQTLNLYEITSAAWLDVGHLAVGTVAGTCLVITAGQVIQQTIPGQRPIYAVGSFQDRFVCAGGGGRAAVYQYYGPGRDAECQQTLVTPEGLDLHGVAAAPSGRRLLLVHGDGRCTQVGVADGGVPAPLSPRQVTEQFPLEVGFHSSAVTAIDVCVQRPIVVTTSTDFCLHVWDFRNRRPELRKSFDEEVFSAACHPTGLFFLLGFRYRLVMFFLLDGELTLLHEWPLNCCRGVRFSHGGQHFAAGSVNRVFLYDTYTFECLASLQGQDDLITCLAFSHDGRRLLSGANNGCLMYWTLDGSFQSYSSMAEGSVEAIQWCGEEAFVSLGRKKLETGANQIVLQCFERGLQVCSILFGEDDDPSCVGSTRSWTPRLRSLSPRCHCLAYDGRIYRSTAVLCTAAQTLAVGTPQGTVRLYRLPLSVEEHRAPFAEYALHSGPVAHLRLSADCRRLFSVGQDGAMVVAEVVPNPLELTHPWPKPLPYDVYELMFASTDRVVPAWPLPPQERRRVSESSETAMEAAVQVRMPRIVPPRFSPLIEALKSPFDGDSDSEAEHLDDISDCECTEDLESMKQELSRIKSLLKKGDAKKVKLRMAVRDLQKQVREAATAPHLSSPRDTPLSNGVTREIVIPVPTDRWATAAPGPAAAAVAAFPPSPRPRAQSHPTDFPNTAAMALPTPPTPAPVRRVSSPVRLAPSLPSALSMPALGTRTPHRPTSGALGRRETLPRSVTPTRRGDAASTGSLTPRAQPSVSSPRLPDPPRASTPPPMRTWVPDSGGAVPYTTYIAYKRRAWAASPPPATPQITTTAAKPPPVVPQLRTHAAVAKAERHSMTPRPLSVRSGTSKAAAGAPHNQPPVPSLKDVSSRVTSRSPIRASRPSGSHMLSARSVPPTSPIPASEARSRSSKPKRDTL
eukprot:EG_transcript_1098